METLVGSPVELANVFVDRLAARARQAQEHRTAMSLVVPGGSVAETFFPVIAQSAIEWSRVDLFWSDERAVPADDPESNYRLADDLLLRRVAIDRARVHRMPAELADLDEGARRYEEEIVRALGATPRFDIVLLGVGPDGHVCSLFPGHPALDVESRLVVGITDSPKPPRARLTLTLPALAGADVFVAAFGNTKAEAVRDAVTNSDSVLPVARAARAGQHAIFLLDPPAAATSTGID